MCTADEHAKEARQLLAGTLHGVLSTHSLEHPGFPFGTLVPYVIGHDGLPLLLLSHLSQHTKNVDADPRCGLVVVESGNGDIQQLSRLSAVGKLLPDSDAADAGRYFRYFPHARSYYEQLGFRFYRYHPVRFHWNAGFATARWFANERIILPNPLSGEEQAGIIQHMNSDHQRALRAYLDNVAGSGSEKVVEMLGIDAEGIDVRFGDRMHRITLPRSIQTPTDARDVLVEMAT